MSLLNLPDDVLEKILWYISFDEVSHCRLVCRRMNYVSKRVLNRGFYRVEKYHAQCLKHVKSQLPRRESERRKHPLARHCDILTAVETRLSLLGMTFMKFMEMNLCCFIPGKVLDEIYKVLRYVTAEQTPVRAHEVLQELRDLSSMAMEHFDEKISPAFRKRKDTGPKIITGLNIYARSLHQCRKIRGKEVTPPYYDWMRDVNIHSKPSTHQNNGEHKIVRWKEEAKHLLQKQNATNKEILHLKQKVNEMSKANGELEKKVTELQSLVSSHVEKVKEQDLKIEFLTRLVENDSLLPEKTPETKHNAKGLSSSSIENAPVPLGTQRRKRLARVPSGDASRKRLKRE